MGEFFEKNVNALRKYQPDFSLEKKHAALGEDRTPSPELELTTLPDGDLDIKTEHKGAPVFIHGGSSPLKTAKSRTEQIELNGNGLIVSFGLGLGYEAREIISKMGPGTNFIIVEPCREIFELAIENTDLTDIISAPNVHFYDYSNKGDAYPYFRRFIDQNNYKNLAAFVIAPYVDIFFKECRDLFFVIDDIRATFEMSDATVMSFTSIWQSNAIKNFKHYLNSYLVSDFFGKFEKTPAVIVSAGPSLSKNISLLKGMEDKCLIISVDTALKPLLENGITPHFVISLDAQEKVVRKLEGLNYDNIPLIYAPTSSSPVVENHRGTKLLSLVQYDFYGDLLKTLGKNTRFLEMGGSVATSAFSFAQHLNCDPVILIGQDLAFTDMKSHIEGTAFYKKIELSDIQGVLSVPSVDGGTVYTNKTLLSYITWFQTYAASDKSGRVYIDATEGGAKILGFECESLAEAAKKYMIKDGVLNRVKMIFEEAQLLSATEKKYLRDNYKSAVSFIEGLPAPAKSASEQLNLIYRLLSNKKPNYSAVNAAYSKIASFENRMASSAGQLSVIGIALAPFVEKMNEEFKNATFKNDLEKNRFAASCYTKYYKEVAAKSEQYIEMLKSAEEYV